MAAYINVFIKTDLPMARFIPVISELLEVDLGREQLDMEERYHAHHAGVDLVLFKADGYEADRNMDFPRYSIQVDIGPLIDDQNHDDRARQIGLTLAREIHTRLGAATMVTRDVQRLIERHGI